MITLLLCIATALLTLTGTVIYRDGLRVTGLRLVLFFRESLASMRPRAAQSGDPLMQRTLARATEEGFEADDEQFEFMAAMRDVALGQLTHLFSQSADAFEVAAMERYLFSPEVAHVEIIETAADEKSVLQMLRLKPDATTLPSIWLQTPSPAAPQGALEDIVHETESLLRREMGEYADIPTMAAVLLYLQSLPQIRAAHATLNAEMMQSRTLLKALLMRHPKTGHPLISKAEMETELAGRI